jgi:hypothetical protein
MGVEGVGGHAEVVGQATHGQGARAALVEQGEGLLDDEVAREEASRLGPGGGHAGPPDTSTGDQRREDEDERYHDR